MLSLLTNYRTALSELRTKARLYPPPMNQGYRVVFYAGQDVREANAESDTDLKSMSSEVQER